MKSTIALLIITCLLTGFTSKSYVSPTPALEAIFEATFPKASDVHWKKEGPLYYVYCKSGNMPIRITYNEQGNMQTCLRYYGTEQLPPYIHNMLTRRFPGAIVMGVTEFYNRETLTFTINLKKNGRIIRLLTNAVGEQLQINHLKDSSVK